VSEIVTDWVYADRLKPNGAIVSEWTTEAITRITGFRPDEVRARGSWLDLVYADDHPILHERTQALLSGKSQVSEYRIIAKSGEIRWLRDHAHPVWGQVQGRVVGVYGAVQDITERKRAEEEIAGLAKFPSENPNSVLRVAKDGIILYANKASLPLLDVWGCQVCQPLPDDWRKFTADVFSSGASKHTEVEYQDHILSLTFSPVVDTGYVNVYGLDITERKQAEEALRESEEKFRMISASAQDAIIMMDSEGNISFWNEAAQKIFGYSS
jgi:PAS domain S-box-containing protein